LIWWIGNAEDEKLTNSYLLLIMCGA